MGVPGLTDSFAACIWAIEISMEFFFINGFRIDFYSSFQTGSKQTLFGPAPTFAPSSLYTTLLFLDLVLANEPYIDQTAVTSGTSSSIRVYGLDYYSNYGVLIINKDMNSSSSGDVAVRLNNQNGLYCIYLTASDLTATSGVTLAGINFVANQSSFVGNFKEYKYVAVDGFYQVPLNYSQVAFCYTKVDKSYNYFPTGSHNPNFEGKLSLLVGLLMMMAIAIY
jgi:hypothetical protein